MNRSGFRALSALLFCLSCMAGAMPGSAVAIPHPMGQQARTASEGMHGERAAADDTKEPTEEDPAGDLEGEINALIEELKKLERDARKVFEEEVLPRIRKEIQRLREKLREFDPEEKRPEPRET